MPGGTAPLVAAPRNSSFIRSLVARGSNGPTSQCFTSKPLTGSTGGNASKSAWSRHCSHGRAGVTGAPRPALVNSAGGGWPVEHDRTVATHSATSATRPLFARVSSVIEGDHRLRRRSRRGVRFRWPRRLWMEQEADGGQARALGGPSRRRGGDHADSGVARLHLVVTQPSQPASIRRRGN